jgi:hypothetical protein
MATKEQIDYLRKCGLKDEQIGGLFGISRERIGQIGGRVKQQIEYDERLRDRVKTLIGYLEHGMSVEDIQHLGPGYDVWGLMRRAGIRYANYAVQRLERRKQLIAGDIQKMLDTGLELNSYNLQRLNLYQKATRVMGVREWRKYFGVK